MTDPFYTQNKFNNQSSQNGNFSQGRNIQQNNNYQINNNQVNNNSQNINNNSQNTTQGNQQQKKQLNPQAQQQLQQILQQEQIALQQIQRLNQMLKNSQQYTPQQQQAIAKQLQQYNQQLQYFAYQKQQLGFVNNSVNHPKIKKKSKKMNTKKFLIGCGLFFIILLGLATVMFYTVLGNPETLANMGLNIETGKQLLKALTSIFFGLIVFTSFGLFIVNTYRLFTVKNKSKIGYIVGSLLGIGIFVGSISIWINVLGKIGKIVSSSSFDNQNLIISSAIFKDGDHVIKDDLQLIAPVVTTHVLNGPVFNSKILPQLGSIDGNKLKIELDCGNGTKVPINLQTLKFEDNCLYVEKGEHNLFLDIDYVNIQTQENLQKVVPAGVINISSEINLTPNGTKLKFNENKTEMIMGKVPRKISFDASEIFKDFGLKDYNITFDLNDDGNIDKKNISLFTYTYKKAQVYNINFRVPDLNNLYYTFPIRIEQSDVPVCEIQPTSIKGTNYLLQTNFIEKNTNITDYIYSIIDSQNNTVLDNLIGQGDSIKYQFPGAGNYIVKVVFQTEDGKKGECESDNINLGGSDFKIDYSLNYKTPSSPDFTPADENKNIDLSGNTIIIKEIPTIIQLKINKILPNNTNAKKEVFLDDKPILSLDNNIFNITIDENKSHKLKILIEDVNRDMKTEKDFNIQIKRDDIVGKILVNPDYVGTDPFSVKFDASTSKVNDPEDEIVYFSRDFGDGVIKNNISQAIVNHTYSYDYKNENGIFSPSVTLTTKKGRKVTINSDQKIIVKKQDKTFTINIDSNPGQLAKVGEKVDFSISIDGSPEKIIRDFGNGQTLECNGRECIEASKIYTKPGTYKIKVTITDSQNPELENYVTLKVQ